MWHFVDKNCTGWQSSQSVFHLQLHVLYVLGADVDLLSIKQIWNKNPMITNSSKAVK
jgi:hypothetical protein